MSTQRTTCRTIAAVIAQALISTPALATNGSSVSDGGVSSLWVLANLTYAGMRAQGSPSARWRLLAFIFGFPGTLLTYFVVTEGSERAYGVDLPRRDR